MNTQSFQELLKRTLRLIPDMAPALKRKAQDAPLFVCGLPESALAANYEQDLCISDGMLVLPFGLLKVLDTQPGPDGSRHLWLFETSRAGLLVFHWIIRGEFTEMMSSWIGRSHVVALAKTETVLMRPSIAYCTLSPIERWYTKSECQNMIDKESWPKQHARMAFEHAMSFAFMVNHPAHHAVSVRPSLMASVGRSVEWVKSKTHYIILDNSAARRLRNGKPVDESKITRAAHNRRAHWRRLTSDRFTKAKGRKLWVRSAWIGPKEWEGTDRKIYKLLELPKS